MDDAKRELTVGDYLRLEAELSEKRKEAARAMALGGLSPAEHEALQGRHVLRNRRLRVPGAQARTIPVCDEVADILERRKAHAGDDGRLFEPWANARRDVSDAARRAGLPPVSPLALQRTFGGWLRAEHVEEHIIQDLVGRRTRPATMPRFGAATEDDLRAAVEKLPRLEVEEGAR